LALAAPGEMHTFTHTHAHKYTHTHSLTHLNTLQIDGFLQQFITPIVKCTKGKKEKTFFTIPQYKSWYDQTEGKGWRIKYYKGLVY
jgi:DNA gyrase/topoisomerase IV subunit B